MNILPLDPALTLLLKATLVLVLAASFHALMRRRASPASRHLVWTLAVMGVLALPVFSGLVPNWGIPIRVTEEVSLAPIVRVETATAGLGAALDRSERGEVIGHTRDGVDASVVDASVPAALGIAATKPDRRTAPGSLILAVYLLGVLLLFIRAAVDRLVMRRITHGAEPVVEPGWTELLRSTKRVMGVEQPVALLRSRGSAMPMTWGTLRPAILIPDGADTWPEPRKRAVLLHELAHIARRDCLTQTLAMLTCAFYWFHPGVWWAARRLRVERELACDDRVLASGTPAPEYARHLLEIARTLRAPRFGTAIAMARPSQLEMRVLAVLDTARVRTVPAARVRLAGTLAAVVLLVPLAAADAVPVAEPQRFPTGEVAEWLADDGEPAQVQELDHGLDAAAGRHEREAVVAGDDGASAAFEAVAEPAPSEGQEGSWTAAHRADAQLHLSLRWNGSQWGRSYDLSEFRGLSEREIGAPTSTAVAFSIEREAGRFDLGGSFQQGNGEGHFRFLPDRRFAETLGALGIEPGRRVSDAELMRLALADVSATRIREFTALGFSDLAVKDLTDMSIHNVTPDFIRTMRSLRVAGTDTVRNLVRMRIHRVTPELIRDLEAVGYRDLPVEQLVRLGTHRVTPEFILEMRELGLQDLSAPDVVSMRTHGVTGEFIREVHALGYRDVTSRDLVRMRIHLVTPELIRDLEAVGYRDLPVEQLVRLGTHRVTPEFILEMRELGLQNLSAPDVVSMRIHGVTGEFIRELHALGYRDLTSRDLVRMRIHRVTPELIRDLEEVGVHDLSIEELTRMQIRGTSGELIRSRREGN